MIFFSTLAVAQNIILEENLNNRGQAIARLYNNLPYDVSCYIQDSYNYYPFIVRSNSYSRWYIVYGVFRWECG